MGWDVACVIATEIHPLPPLNYPPQVKLTPFPECPTNCPTLPALLESLGSSGMPLALSTGSSTALKSCVASAPSQGSLQLRISVCCSVPPIRLVYWDIQSRSCYEKSQKRWYEGGIVPVGQGDHVVLLDPFCQGLYPPVK